MLSLRTFLPALLLLCLVAISSAFAEEIPATRVGRIAVLDGAVAVRPAGGDWGDSAVNEPVAAGMSLRTPAQGRAMLRVGAEALALAPATEIAVAELDSGGTQIVLRQGRIGVRLSQFDPARSIEIDLPHGGVWLLTPGDYDIAAGDEQTSARLAVIEGRARFVGKGVDTAVATGSAALLNSGDPVMANLDAAKPDGFVEWWHPAAADNTDPPALRYVSADMTGYDALDANGAWRNVDGYGAVWFPKDTPDGWAPYRNGRWHWIAPWGWTWIDDMAWGFAPSHYGRWGRIADPETGIEQWGWVPGKLDEHPAYAPAVVAFLGTAGVGLSCPDAFGPAVAWFPLAPGEVYWPSYSGDPDLIRRLNDGAGASVSRLLAASGGEPPAEIVDGDYRNRRFASVVPRPVFLAGKPVAPAMISLPARRLDNAPLLAGSPQLSPAPAHTAIASQAPSARLGRAVATLARILSPHGKTATRDALVAHAHIRGGHTHPRVVYAVARSRVVSVGNTRLAHARLHLAAASRRR